MTNQLILRQYYQQAISLYRAANYARARTVCLAALRESSEAIEILHLLGAIDVATRSYDTALSWFEQILEKIPDNTDALYDYATLLTALAQHEKALAVYEHLSRLQPNSAVIYYRQGELLMQLERYREAKTQYAIGLIHDPNDSLCYCGLGLCLYKMKEFTEALECYNKALTLNANQWLVHNRKGNLLNELHDYETALACYQEAQRLNPQEVMIACNIGNVLLHLNRLADARASYEHAIQLDAQFIDAYKRLAEIAFLQRDDANVWLNIEKCLALNPQNAHTHLLKATFLLIYGQFIDGWREYEWRKQLPESKMGYLNQPLPGLSQLTTGVHVLVYSEQGYGDNIQYCRYLRLLQQRGVKVTFGINEKLSTLIPLFNTLKGFDNIITFKNSIDLVYQYYIPIMSLPYLFNTTIDSVPASIPYLAINNKLLHAWQQQLSHLSTLKVGLVWRGNPLHENDQRRSVILTELLAFLPVGPTYISLQNVLADDKEHALLLAHNIAHYGDQLTDFAQTAALCAAVDLIISVDTSVAHLAGALGKPIWLLLPFFPDWRWLINRTDSPWYPSMRLYRQTVYNEWHSVYQRLAKDLDNILHHRQ